jgi:hypothetical protein
MLRLWHDTRLATIAQESVACFDLLSHVVKGGGVLCRVRLSCSGVCCVVVFASACCVSLLLLLI